MKCTLKILFFLLGLSFFITHLAVGQCLCEDDITLIKTDDDAKVTQPKIMVEYLRKKNKVSESILINESVAKKYPGNKLKAETTLLRIVDEVCYKIHSDTTGLKKLIKLQKDNLNNNFSKVRASILCKSVKKIPALKETEEKLDIDTTKKDKDVKPENQQIINSPSIEKLEAKIRLLWIALSLLSSALIISLVLLYRMKKANSINLLQKLQLTGVKFEEIEGLYENDIIKKYISKRHIDENYVFKHEYDKVKSEETRLRESNLNLQKQIDDRNQKDNISAGQRLESMKPQYFSGSVSKVFASVPTGKTFNRLSEALQPYESYYMIEYYTGSNEGILKLVEDPETRSHAFSMTDNLKEACDLKGTGRPSISQKISETPGRVEKQGEYWTIVKPIILDW